MNVGSKIICINATPNPGSDAITIRYLSYLKKGQIYTVREIYDIQGITAVLLEEVTTPFSDRTGHELGYRLERFRPVTDSDIWAEDMLQQIVEQIEDEFLVKIEK